MMPSAKTSMNGQIYHQLNEDLNKTSNVVFTSEQAERASRFIINEYQSDARDIVINHPVSQLVVFMDKKHQAHWAYHISFDSPARAQHPLPAKPNYIVDAITFKTYQAWDNIKTAKVKGGGFGGNQNTGKLSYDGLAGHLASFHVKRKAGICYFKNADIIVKHAMTDEIMQYPCAEINAEHQVYWSGDFDHVNGASSPANDVMFAAQVVKQLYKDWYQIPVLKNADGSDMVLQMNVHVPKFDNAYWNGESMTFGDGQELYPLTTLGITAHEVSHGFTEQHSDLNYQGQSGGMNEAFSDMAGQTAEYYGYGKTSWSIGAEIFKLDNEVMRFMDQPSKDCYGKEPGTFCSIDNAKQYYEGLDVHFSSGVYNRAFYLLSTTPDWTPRKAFAVMLHANASYWLSQTEFADGAACVVKAAEDLHYDVQAVKKAFETVGISVSTPCTNQTL